MSASDPAVPASAAVRAATLDAQLHAMRWRERLAGEELEELRKQVAWMRSTIAAQEGEIERLREELRRVRLERRRTSVEKLVRALSAAVEAGEAALADRVIAAATAEITASLEVADGDAGLVVGGARELGREAASTISVDLRRAPPTPAQEAWRVAALEVSAAALELQAALDRPLSGLDAALVADALARASELAAVPPGAAGLVAALRALAGVLVPLSAPIPPMAEAAAALAGLTERLEAAPSPDALAAVAGGLRELVAVLP